MAPFQQAITTATNNGAAIILWMFTGTSVYFLKSFADSVKDLRKEVTALRVWMARIGQQIGVEERREDKS